MNDWEATRHRLGGVSRSTVFALWKSGQLGSVKIGKRRFSTDRQVDAYIEQLEQQSGGAA